MARTNRLNVLLGAVALAAALTLALLYWQQRRADGYNAAVVAGDWGGAAAVASAGYLDFVRGYQLRLGQQLQPALSAYADAARTPALADAARFNMANAYLQRALSVDLDSDDDLALPLVELAKQSYRELLARRPDFWDAKYNLERALQRFPDVEQSAIQEWQAVETGPREVMSIKVNKELP